MAKIVITEELKRAILDYLKARRNNDLVETYLYYLENRYDLHPVVFLRGKMIYKSQKDAVKQLEEQGKLWHETEIKIRFGKADVNEETKRIYICPFTGKVFGNNTHPNPQDAIYDWVSTCPENKERSSGIKVKRFFISEDLELIKSYMSKNEKTVSKKVFSSVVSGKIFNDKKSILADFKKNYIKKIDLVAAQNQNRFELDVSLLEFLQEHMDEERISNFIEAMAEYDEFAPYLSDWIEE